jgi:hypothetical protein
MRKKSQNLILKTSNNKKEAAMKKSLGIGLMVLVMSLVLAMSSAYCGELIVDDQNGKTSLDVTPSGLVGIKTTNPQGSLHIVDTTSGTRGLVTAQHSTDTQAAVMIFRKTRGTETTPTAVVNGDYLGTFHVTAWDGNSYLYPASFYYLVDGPVTQGHVPTSLGFIVGDGSSRPERMRITSSGNVGFSVSNPTYPIQMASGARCTAGGVWTNASSREYKENIKELSTKDAILAFNKLDPVTYNYKVDKNEKHVGFIAEDVPDLVATQDRKALSAMDIVAVLTKVVQEQERTIAELKEKVNMLEQQVK